jgi:hypothetical protein
VYFVLFILFLGVNYGLYLCCLWLSHTLAICPLSLQLKHTGGGITGVSAILWPGVRVSLGSRSLDLGVNDKLGRFANDRVLLLDLNGRGFGFDKVEFDSL